MANDNLRAALQRAGLTVDDLAQIVEVDVRTVRRWLSGRTPYPRQRGKVVRALDTTEHTLWPEIAIAPPAGLPAAQATDLLAAYPTASDQGAPDWKVLMRDAADRIELLGDTLNPILATPGVPELLATKGTHGCRIRILVSDPGRHLALLQDQPGIEMRVLQAPAHLTIHRYDEQLLLTLQLLGQDTDEAPLLHLRRIATGGLFDRFADHYNDLWEQYSRPIDSDLDALDEDQDFADRDEERGADSHGPEDASRRAATVKDASPPPRRWPRRPG